jgi:4-hydroxy-tetrahydrodipicolinate synthase
VIDAFLAEDYPRAAALQLDFALFPSRWMHRGLAPTMKAAMNLIGIAVGEPYPPYVSLTSEELNAMAMALRKTSLACHIPATAAAQSAEGTLQ